MDATHAYTFTTASWLSLQALPLFLSPKLMITMLSPDTRQPTDLETYFSRTLALTLVTLALLTILLMGIVPLSSVTAESECSSPNPPSSRSPRLSMTPSFSVREGILTLLKLNMPPHLTPSPPLS